MNRPTPQPSYFLIRWLYFLMLSITAPLWLVLRGWYGPRFAIILFAASLAHPVSYLLLAGLIDIVSFSETMQQMEVLANTLFALLILGFMFQSAVIVLQVVLVMMRAMWKSHPAFGGSFLLWPSSRPN